jgi:hypothetical protein
MRTILYIHKTLGYAVWWLRVILFLKKEYDHKESKTIMCQGKRPQKNTPVAL